jgi:hypothetical protein
MRALLVSTLAVMVFAQAAAAITGNELKMWMNEEEAVKDGRPGASAYKAGLYDGYVQGIAEMFNGGCCGPRRDPPRQGDANQDREARRRVEESLVTLLFYWLPGLGSNQRLPDHTTGGVALPPGCRAG